MKAQHVSMTGWSRLTTCFRLPPSIYTRNATTKQHNITSPACENKPSRLHTMTWRPFMTIGGIPTTEVPSRRFLQTSAATNQSGQGANTTVGQYLLYRAPGLGSPGSWTRSPKSSWASSLLFAWRGKQATLRETSKSPNTFIQTMETSRSRATLLDSSLE